MPTVLPNFRPILKLTQLRGNLLMSAVTITTAGHTLAEAQRGSWWNLALRTRHSLSVAQDSSTSTGWLITMRGMRVMGAQERGNMGEEVAPTATADILLEMPAPMVNKTVNCLMPGGDRKTLRILSQMAISPDQNSLSIPCCQSMFLNQQNPQRMS